MSSILTLEVPSSLADNSFTSQMTKVFQDFVSLLISVQSTFDAPQASNTAENSTAIEDWAEDPLPESEVPLAIPTQNIEDDRSADEFKDSFVDAPETTGNLNDRQKPTEDFELVTQDLRNPESVKVEPESISEEDPPMVIKKLRFENTPSPPESILSAVNSRWSDVSPVESEFDSSTANPPTTHVLDVLKHLGDKLSALEGRVSTLEVSAPSMSFEPDDSGKEASDSDRGHRVVREMNEEPTMSGGMGPHANVPADVGSTPINGFGIYNRTDPDEELLHFERRREPQQRL